MTSDRYRIMVLEGPVGAGKTSVARMLGSTCVARVGETPLGVRAPNLAGTWGWVISDWVKGAKARLRASRHACVVDRGWLTTAALRCHDGSRGWDVDRWHSRFGHPVTVVLDVDPRIGLRRKMRAIESGNPFADPDLIAAHQSWIAHTLAERGLPHILLDTTERSVENCAALLLAKLFDGGWRT